MSLMSSAWLFVIVTVGRLDVQVGRLPVFGGNHTVNGTLCHA